MPAPEDIRSTVDSYAERFAEDREGWVSLFAPDATVEDPVGSDLREGHEAIGEFWDFVHGMVDAVRIVRTGPVRVAGDEAAWPFQIRSTVAGAEMVLDVIDAMTFDDEARITSMRAYWDMADMRPADA